MVKDYLQVVKDQRTKGQGLPYKWPRIYVQVDKDLCTGSQGLHTNVQGLLVLTSGQEFTYILPRITCMLPRLSWRTVLTIFSAILYSYEYE